MFWKAFCLASGLWLPIWIYKKCVKGRKHREKSLLGGGGGGGGKKGGSYSKIEEGQGGLSDGASSHHNSAIYDVPAGTIDAPYAQGGTGYVGGNGQEGARFEPYATAYGSTAAATPPVMVGGGTGTTTTTTTGGAADDYFTASKLEKERLQEPPVIIGPIEQTGAVPLPSPCVSPAPTMNSSVTAPPPYQQPPPQQQQSVFMPPPAAHAAYPSTPAPGPISYTPVS